MLDSFFGSALQLASGLLASGSTPPAVRLRPWKQTRFQRGCATRSTTSPAASSKLRLAINQSTLSLSAGALTPPPLTVRYLSPFLEFALRYVVTARNKVPPSKHEELMAVTCLCFIGNVIICSQYRYKDGATAASSVHRHF